MAAMKEARRAIKRPTGGWLRAVRQALGVSSVSVAEKLGISRQGYLQIEANEARGAASLQSLDKAARALGCDLIYFLLPRSELGESFEAVASRTSISAKHLQASEHSMALEGQEDRSKTDAKNIGLANQIYRLRQNLSLYELITVNSGKLREAGASEPLFAHIQHLALDAIATTLCRVYEREEGPDLNSIDGVINALPAGTATDAQRRAAERFAERHGIVRACHNPRDYLREVLMTFLGNNADAFDSLRRFRDKHAAHAEPGFELEALPSFDEFEELYGFAYEFYFLVADAFLGVGPALMSLHVGTGFIRLLKQLNIANPAPGFSTDTDV